MENGFLKKNKILGINLLYILSLLPIIGFAFYKNGFLVYKEGYISLFASLQYLVIPIIIILLSYVFETYYYLCIKKEETTNSVVNSIVPFVNALCYLVCGPNDKLYIVVPLIVALDVIMKFIDNKFTVNRVALFKCVLFGLLTALSMYNNCNLFEANLSNRVSGTADLFLGLGIGEIGVTSTLFAIVGFVILLFNKYYKKDIPLVSIIGYALVCLVIYFVGGIKFNDIIINTFDSGFIFAAIFVASLSTATPIVSSGRIIYGLLVGILSAVLVNVFDLYVGIYIVILVLSLIVPILNKFKLSVE